MAVTKSTNQSNFSRINLSILSNSLDEQWALQSITNSGVIEIMSSSSLHFAAIYKQPTATHSKNFGRTLTRKMIFSEKMKISYFECGKKSIEKINTQCIGIDTEMHGSCDLSKPWWCMITLRTIHFILNRNIRFLRKKKTRIDKKVCSHNK